MQTPGILIRFEYEEVLPWLKKKKKIRRIGILTSGGDAPRHECRHPCCNQNEHCPRH